MRYILFIFFYGVFLPFSLFSQSTFQSFFKDGIPFTECYDVITTSDGGFLVSGNTTELGSTSNVDYYVIKLDKNGKEDWSYIQDFDLGILADVILCAVELDDSYILLSYSWNIQEAAVPYPYLIYLDKQSGMLKKSIELSDFNYQYFNKIEKTNDGNLIILGYTREIIGNEVGPFMMTLLKINEQGDMIWQEKLEETSFSSNIPPNFEDMGLKIDLDGNIYASGGFSTIDVVKTNSEGELLWIDSIFISNNSISHLDLQTDGVVVSAKIIGVSNSGRMYKYDSIGNLIWTEDYSDSSEGILSCVVNAQNEIFTAGMNDDNLVYMKLDSNGELIWSKFIYSENPTLYYQARDIKVTEDGGFVIVGNFSTSISGGGIFVFRLNSEGEFGDILDTSSTPLFNTTSIDIFPNPTTDRINIQNEAETIEELQVTLFDMKANKIHQETMNGQQSDINMENLPAGSYILELRNKKNQAYQKLVVKQ